MGHQRPGLERSTPGWSIILPEGLSATPGNILIFPVWCLAILDQIWAGIPALVVFKRCAHVVPTFLRPREPEFRPMLGPKWPKNNSETSKTFPGVANNPSGRIIDQPGVSLYDTTIRYRIALPGGRNKQHCKHGPTVPL